MHWKTKAAAFRVLDALPLGKTAHFALQRHVTKNWPRPEAAVRSLFDATKKAVDEFETRAAEPRSRAVFLEVGAGRDLAVPLTLRSLGISRVLTIDIDRLARIDLVNSAAKAISKITGRSLPRFASWQDLREFGVDYRAPCSIDQLTGETLDAFVSNEVLEHVSPQALRAMISTAYELLSPGGLAIHNIDYSDHFARGGSVSRYNFLQYSSDRWQRYNSNFQYVNRLRHSEYIEVFQQAGFVLVSDDPYSEEIPASILSSLADEFRTFAISDLSVMRSRIVFKKPG